MARVAITDELINEVKHIIKHMEHQALETEAPMPPPPKYDFQQLVDMLWGHDIHLQGLFVELNDAKKLGRELKTFTVGSQINMSTKSHRGDLISMPHAECPRNAKMYGPPKLHPSSYSTPSIVLLPTNPLAVPFVERYENKQEVEARFKAMQMEITVFLVRCPSLNEAVKLVPEIAMYIPGWAKVKLEEKVVRAKRAAPTLPSELPDVERMVVTAITHRMESS